MKMILNVSAAMCLCAILFVSCEQPNVKQSAAPHTGNVSDADVSQKNNKEANAAHTNERNVLQINELTENSMLILFGLTRET